MEHIVIKNVSKVYGKVTAVNNMNLTINKGEVFAIVGANGAGKTTLLEMMMGLRNASQGEIVVLGKKMSTSSVGLKEKIGVLLQDSNVYMKLKVRELLELYSSYYKETSDIDTIISDLELEPCLKKNYANLSGGWKQRVSLALAFINNPEIIFLDEPTTGLDPESRRIMWKNIKKYQGENKTIILSTHYMEEVNNYCDKVLVMFKGKKMALGSPQDLLQGIGKENATMEDVFLYYSAKSAEEAK